MNKINKTTTIVFGVLFAIIVFTVVASAAQTQLRCLTQGQKILFSQCNSHMHDLTCTSSTCQVCVERMDNGIFCPRNPNACNSMSLTCTTSTNSSDNSSSSLPPTLTVNSPQNGSLYRSQSVLVNLESNEPVSFYYKSVLETRWTRISSSSSTANQLVRFNEGMNDIMFRAADPSGNSVDVERVFFIDSKIPQILSTDPKRGFTNGTFSVRFKEDNPKNVTLHITNGVSSTDSLIDLNTCNKDRSFMSCWKNLSLISYDGTQIEYWFTVQDIAGNSKDSKHTKVNVDLTAPAFNKLNYTIQKTRVLFDIMTSEKVTLGYTDQNDARPTFKNLCRDCTSYNKASSFKSGNHTLVIQAIDKAGNSVQKNISFFI